MAIAIVQKDGQSNAGASASVTLTGVSAGNAIVVLALSFNSTYTVADTNGTPVKDAGMYAANAPYNLSIWTVLNCASGSHTLSISGGSTNSAVHAWEVSGLATSSAFDVSASGNSTGPPTSAATATTAQAVELVIGCIEMQDGGGTPLTIGSGFSDSKWTKDGTFGREFLSEARVVSSTGTYTVHSATGLQVCGCLVATYKGASTDHSGSLSSTLGAATVAGTGTVSVSGTTSSTLGAATLSGTAVTSTNSIAVTTPAAYQTRQRNGSNQADIPITGTYSGAPTSIEASFNGGAYQTIVASPTGGTYSGTLTAQATGQGTLTVRWTNNTSIAATVANVSIGDVFVVIGDSTARGTGTNNQSFTGTPAATMYRASSWQALADPVGQFAGPAGSVWPKFCSLFVADQGVPVGIISTAYDGTTLTEDWQSGGGQITGTMSTVSAAALGASPKAWFCHLGAVDSWETAPASSAAWQSLVEGLRTTIAATHTGAILFIQQLGEQTGGPPAPTRAALDAIRNGTRLAVNASGGLIVMGPVLYDIVTDDGTHYNGDSKITTIGTRWWLAVKEKFYSGAARTGRGPQVTNLSANSAKTVTTVTMAMATEPITPSSSIAGFRVLDSGTPVTISGAVRASNTTITLTHTAVSGTLTVDLGSGNDYAGTSVPKDSSSNALPSEAFSGGTITDVYGAVSSTLGAMTCVGTAVVTNGPTAALDSTLSAATVAASGTVSVSAAAGITLDALTVTGYASTGADVVAHDIHTWQAERRETQWRM